MNTLAVGSVESRAGWQVLTSKMAKENTVCRISHNYEGYYMWGGGVLGLVRLLGSIQAKLWANR